MDTTERLPFHFSLSCIGEGNGNPLQCSCLENPRDGGAWWAAVYGVAQSRTRLKQLSSSSSVNNIKWNEFKTSKLIKWTRCLVSLRCMRNSKHTERTLDSMKQKFWMIFTRFSSVQFHCSVMSNSLRPHESQHARPPCPSPTPGVHSDSRPSSQ